MVLEGCQAGSCEWPYMVKSAVSRTEQQKQQRQRQQNSIEVLEHKLWPKNGEGLWILCTPSVFLCVETEHSLVSSQTVVMRDRTEILCHCAHTQGFLTAKVEYWMNGALKDWIQIKHTLHIWSFFLHRDSVWSTNVEHAFYIKHCTMWCYGCS